MSKLIFSTLSILALLLSGTNCSTVTRGGGAVAKQPASVATEDGGAVAQPASVATEGGGSQPCTAGLVLNPGDGCSGSNYSLLNKDGELKRGGPYFKRNGPYSCGREVYVSGNSPRGKRRPGSFECYPGSLYLTEKDKVWTIKRLPSPRGGGAVTKPASVATEGGGSQPCTKGLILNPGDGCSGSNYRLLNEDGDLKRGGTYFDSCSNIYNRGSFNGVPNNFFICDSLYLTGEDKAWTIKSLPPSAATGR